MQIRTLSSSEKKVKGNGMLVVPSHLRLTHITILFDAA